MPLFALGQPMSLIFLNQRQPRYHEPRHWFILAERQILQITGYSADGRIEKYSQSITRLLRNVQEKAGTRQARNLATRTLSQLDQIRAMEMSAYLGKSVSQQSAKAVLTSSGRWSSAARMSILRQFRRVLAKKLLQRAAGPIAAFVALAMDAKDLYDNEFAYRAGAISVRQRNIRLFTTLGGISGAFAGGWAGGVTGAWLGGFGGPFAWITAPTGGVLGVIIGGVGGYFGGSVVAGYGATAWYNSIDKSVRDKFELAWIGANGPGL
jgi:hypothetical protein